MAALVLLVGLFGASLAIPPPTPEEFALKVLGLTPKYENVTVTPHKRVSYKHYYVGYGGAIQRSRGSGSWLDVEATHAVSETAHYRAAKIAAAQTKHMPYSIFNPLASRAKVGVFTQAEHLTVFPEYAGLAHTNTGDGRPYTSLAGTGGSVAAILDHNVMCDGQDPYHGHSNILVHEFAHTIHTYGLDATWKAAITRAYANGRNIWSSSYATSNEQEYFAEASGVYFNVEHNGGYASGGMESCNHVSCRSEADARYWLYTRDRDLYNVLTYVYTDNHPDRHSGLRTCMT